jgi:hypothetical protein
MVAPASAIHEGKSIDPIRTGGELSPSSHSKPTLMSISLADTIFWIAVACCSVAQIAIVRSLFVAAPADAPPDVAMPRASAARGSELVWSILPGIALAYVLFVTWRAIHPSAP